MNALPTIRRSIVPHSLLMLMLVALIGCGPDHSGPAPTYVYVVDYSGSTAAGRKQQLGQMLAELESAPDDTNVVIYRMGSETEEVFSGPLGDAGTDALVGTLKRDLMGSDSVKGTNFAKMANALLAFSKRFKAESYRLRIMTDGGNYFTDAASLHSYHEAASLLSSDKHLSSVVFYGVQPQFRRGIRDAFGNAGQKLQLLDQGQVTSE